MAGHVHELLGRGPGLNISHGAQAAPDLRDGKEGTYVGKEVEILLYPLVDPPGERSVLSNLEKGVNQPHCFKF